MVYQKLEIYRPLLSKRIAQHFGDNKACQRANGTIYGINSGKCPEGQSFYESIKMKGHNGMDIAAFIGEDVFHAATFPGWFSAEADYDGGLGVDVVSNEPLFFPMPIPTELINSAVPHEQNGERGFTHYVKMRYWHLKMPIGHDKKQITCGMTIGLAGNTGASSGPHLHFAPKWCLPDGRGVGQSNGFTGAFDPLPYYNHEFTAQEHMKMMQPTVLQPELSEQERKDIVQQLTWMQMVVVLLQKLINKI